MRTSILAMVILSLSAPLHAQSTSTEVIRANAAPVDQCRRFDSPPAVVVTMRDGQRLRGTLMCLGDEVELATGGKLSRSPLSDVSRIAEPRDPVWDGAIKGAAMGAIFWALCGRGCDSSYMARATADYALLGLVIDAATSNNKTIYKANIRSPAISFRLRF